MTCLFLPKLEGTGAPPTPAAESYALDVIHRLGTRRRLILPVLALVLGGGGCVDRAQDSGGSSGNTAGVGGAGGSTNGGAGGASGSGVVYPCAGEFPSDAGSSWCDRCDDPDASCFTEPGESEPLCTLDNRCEVLANRCTTDDECGRYAYCCTTEHCLAPGASQGICRHLGCGPGPYCVTTDSETGTCRYVPDLAAEAASCHGFVSAPSRISGTVVQRSAAHTPAGVRVEFFNELDEPVCDPIVLAERVSAFSAVTVTCVSHSAAPRSIKMVVTPPDGSDPECDRSNNTRTFEVYCRPLPCLEEVGCPSDLGTCLIDGRCYCIAAEDACYCMAEEDQCVCPVDPGDPCSQP